MRSRHVLNGGSFAKLYRTTMSAFTKLNKGFLILLMGVAILLSVKKVSFTGHPFCHI